MKDPREILAEKLIEDGIDKSEAYIIALDAGSGHVSKQYVNDLNMEQAQKELVRKHVTSFYWGDMEEEEE